MIPQDRFVIVAKVPDHNVEGLRSLLRTMTFPEQTGFADPANSLVPFGEFETIHFARFAVLADNTLKDREGYYPPLRFEEPTYLCFMADSDGDADELLARIARKADGLRKIFSYCEDFVETGDLLGWLRTHRVQPLASYVNWVGRTVVQAKEEARLHGLLRKALPEIDERDPQDILARLRQSVRPAVSLTPTPPTPLAWRIRDLAHMLLPLLVAAACFVLFPILTIVLLAVGTLLFVIALRWHEQTDPIIPQPYDPENVTRLRKGEDHDVTNQYTAMGSLKPGRFRLWTCPGDYLPNRLDSAPHLSRAERSGASAPSIPPIGCLSNSTAAAFSAPTTTAAHEAYMDDFINKVGFGLNLAFSGSVAYPTTDWLRRQGRLARAGLQAIPAASPDSDRRLVQGVSGTDRPRPFPQQPHSQRF